MNNQDRYLPFLDTFRGVAILMVIGLHCFSGLAANVSLLAQSTHIIGVRWPFVVLDRLLCAGTYGVAIFFVVSGFCIHLSHRRSKAPIGLIFFIRRIFRIYPAYLISLLLFIFVLPLTRWPIDWPNHDANKIDLLLHLSLAQNFLPQTLATIALPYWSLAIEFQLYLLFPLLLVMMQKIGWRQALIVTAIVELVSRLCLIGVSLHQPQIAPADWWGWQKLSPFSFWFSWSLGAIIAEAFVDGQPLPFSRGPLPLWFWPLAVLVFDNIPFLKPFAFPVAAFGTARFLGYFLARDPSTIPAKNPPWLQFISFTGVISYSIYLLHEPLFRYGMTFVPVSHGVPLLFLVRLAGVAGLIAAIMAVSYLLFRFVETPGIAWGKVVIKWFRGSLPVAPAVTESRPVIP